MSIELRQIDRIPELGPDLPADSMFFQLGCAGCFHAVCFEAVGATSFEPGQSLNTFDLQELLAITEAVEKGQAVLQVISTQWLNSCSEGPCPNDSDITMAVAKLNDRFDSDLKLPAARVA